MVSIDFSVLREKKIGSNVNNRGLVFTHDFTVQLGCPGVTAIISENKSRKPMHTSYTVQVTTSSGEK